ncbi:MAG: hypothetical protein ACI8X5_000205 [Planctomycetota bacterium]|jgi:hypothetical protein
MFGNGVPTSVRKGVAAQDPPGRMEASSEDSVAFDGLEGVLAASGLETAGGGSYPRKRALIKADRQDEQPACSAHKAIRHPAFSTFSR